MGGLEIMADFPLYHGSRLITVGANTTNSRGTLVYTATSAHTKGSWTEIDSSIPEGVTGFWVVVEGGDTYRYLFDVGIGSGPTTIISNAYWYSRPYLSGHKMWFPIALPPGEALSVRLQSGSSSQRVAGFMVIYQVGPFVSSSPMAGTETWGITAGSTIGVQLDPGATGNTKSSWTEIVSSTTHSCRAFQLMIGHGSDQYPPSIPSVIWWLIDIAIGAASSEETILENLSMNQDTASDCFGGNTFVGPFEMVIPAGSRVSARLQCNVTDTTYRYVRMGILGYF
jgi:hypothetical protein